MIPIVLSFNIVNLAELGTYLLFLELERTVHNKQADLDVPFLL